MKHPSYCCPECGAPIGWLGRLFQMFGGGFHQFDCRPVQTMEQLAAAQPPAPCGEQTLHWQWVLIEGMPCPACAVAERIAAERAAEKRLAGLIADAVVAKLVTKTIPSQEV